MNKLLSKVKLLLYKYKLLKTNDLYSKLDYIKLSNFSIYNSDYKGVHLPFISKDIIKYIDELKYINNYNINISYIKVKAINNDTFSDISIMRWMTDDSKILKNDIAILKLWCEESEKIFRRYDIISKDPNNHVAYSNSIKIKPYIINIEYIVDGIFNII